MMPDCLIPSIFCLIFLFLFVLVRKISIDVDGRRCIQHIKIIIFCGTQMTFETVDNGLLARPFPIMLAFFFGIIWLNKHFFTLFL